MFRFVSVALAAVILSGCTSIGFTPDQMKPKPNVYTFIDQNALTKNVKIGDVTLSDEMPEYGYVVKSELFRETLSQAFNQAGWLSTKDKSRYTLSAHFIKHEIPFSVINTKVFSIVHYTLHDNVKDVDAYDQTITIPCVVATAEIYDAAQRQIAATSCSVGENVTQLINELNNNF